MPPTPDERQPRTAAGSRAGRRQGSDPVPGAASGAPGGHTDEPPGVDIHPPRWLAVTLTGFAALGGGMGLLAAVGSVAQGDVGNAVASFVAGALFAYVVFDSAGRSARTDGDRLVLRQWYREIVLDRHDLNAFVPSRGSLWRWDIVAERREPVRGRHQVRLWASRSVVAGHRQRSRWLRELERWLTARAVSGDRK